MTFDLWLLLQGVKLPMCVVEITIAPFLPDPTAHWTTLQLHPVYENEEGKCLFRQIASNHAVSAEEMVTWCLAVQVGRGACMGGRVSCYAYTHV